LDRLKKADIDPRVIYNIVQNYLPKVEGIERMIYKEDIINSAATDKITHRLQNMIHPHETPEIFPIVTKGYLYKSPYGTGHGSPYDYDTHVPLIFSHIHFDCFLNATPQATVDIAPTIAQILGVQIPEYCDGKAIQF
jgi:hypothetical protein